MIMEASTTTTLVDRGMPSAALRLLFMSIEEVMGPDGIKAVLNGAKLSSYIDNYPPNTIEYGVTFSEYGKVEQAVEDFLGPRGARAILREQSALLGIAGNTLKNLPIISTQAKMKILLQQIVHAANEKVNQPARLEENEDAFLVVINQCMCQWRPRHDKPCCLVTVGTFSEAMKWLTDKPVEVKEITCLNNGSDACRYQIPKRMPEER